MRAATLDGARALGLQDRLGSIEPGKFADLAAVDLSDPDMQPIHDPVSQLIFTAGRDQVTDVWIAGTAVVNKRQLAVQRARDTASEVRARYVVWHNRLGKIVPEAT